jgi:hypothetical protein
MAVGGIWSWIAYGCGWPSECKAANDDLASFMVDRSVQGLRLWMAYGRGWIMVVGGVVNARLQMILHVSCRQISLWPMAVGGVWSWMAYGRGCSSTCKAANDHLRSFMVGISVYGLW